MKQPDKKRVTGNPVTESGILIAGGEALILQRRMDEPENNGK